MSTFEGVLHQCGITLKRQSVRTLQINIGKRCNQACHHCHVESGPNRTENMELPTIDRLLELLASASGTKIVDITGGAPELNPHFRCFVNEVRAMGKTVIDRCNLTIFFEEGQERTAEFLAKNCVEVVASLPCYLEEHVDAQRGNGTFNKSIEALKLLNSLGYGIEGSGLVLNLVHNPVGIHLPPDQKQLESDYRVYLKEKFCIIFNSLFTITNMPIKRYAHMLKRMGKMSEYMQLLKDNFNPNAAEGVMCANMLSIGWDGKIYDCDFNQMLDIPLNGKPVTIWDIDNFSSVDTEIAFADHCFGCTSGAGSSCGGALL